MFSKPRSWVSGGLWKPKNPHSLEHLKYLHGVLCKHPQVTEQNCLMLVEALRSISEILIWGDQNDSTVFDFFLEKNMLSYFLKYMSQKSGGFICVQLLQTLNILFENIRNETSVYYLLSNNHINSILVHKFDFSDEEIMAYYISFLKTLSLKLNKHSIHFFYNEQTNDFALYTEAIKFFNHPESMVRIAVRTITLNVYAVQERPMLAFIRDRTAAPYFSNLVWFIGSHILELDSCVRNDADHNSRDRLADLVAEHLDHLHYINDILILGIDQLNDVLTDHLLNRLFIPLYIYSLTKVRDSDLREVDRRPHVARVVALFLLSQAFLILHHSPLVRRLARILFHGDLSVCLDLQTEESPISRRMGGQIRGFIRPSEPLAQSLESQRKMKPSVKRPNYKNDDEEDENVTAADEENKGDETPVGSDDVTVGLTDESSQNSLDTQEQEMASYGCNVTDEEKLAAVARQSDLSLNNRPYLQALFTALSSGVDDYEVLFGLCVFYAIGHNKGINQDLLDTVMFHTDKSDAKTSYNTTLVEAVISIVTHGCKEDSKVRLATLEMAIRLLKTLVRTDGTSYLQDEHLAAVEGAREEATFLLRNFYKSEEIFLDMFEDEYREMQRRPLNVEYLMMDASILLPPTQTPLSGIDFNKRLPCGEVERARRAIRAFFHLRELSLTLQNEQETQLPLTKTDECVKENDTLDLNNSDLIACTIITKENKKERRFLVIDVLQLILVEPDTRRLGWGVVRFTGFLQDVDVSGDKDDSRSLHVTIHKPQANAHARPLTLLSARFVFDDHIRCMAAKQRLAKGRLKARQRKMQMIARLLDMPRNIVDSIIPASQSTSSTPKPSAVNQRVAQNTLQAHPGRAAIRLSPGRAALRTVRNFALGNKDTSPSPQRHHSSPNRRREAEESATSSRVEPMEDLTPTRLSRRNASRSPGRETLVAKQQQSDGHGGDTSARVRKVSSGSSGSIPKSLAPATGPAASLLAASEVVPDSPKIVPPALRVRSPSETTDSSTSSSAVVTSAATAAADGASTPELIADSKNFGGVLARRHVMLTQSEPVVKETDAHAVPTLLRSIDTVALGEENVAVCDDVNTTISEPIIHIED